MGPKISFFPFQRIEIFAVSRICQSHFHPFCTALLSINFKRKNVCYLSVYKLSLSSLLPFKKFVRMVLLFYYSFISFLFVGGQTLSQTFIGVNWKHKFLATTTDQLDLRRLFLYTVNTQQLLVRHSHKQRTNDLNVFPLTDGWM